MKKTILFGLLVGLFGLLSTAHLRAAEAQEELNMSIKISPGLPRVGEPVIYEAVTSGGNGTYHIAWSLGLEDKKSTGLDIDQNDAEPAGGTGIRFTNTFRASGLKTVNVTVQSFDATGFQEFVSREVTFYVENSRNTEVTVLYPNGKEIWKNGETYEIRWNHTGSARKVQIRVYYYYGNQSESGVGTIISQETENDDPSNFIRIDQGTENDGSFNFTVPSDTNLTSASSSGAKTYRVKVYPLGGDGRLTGDGSDESDGSFTIIAPTAPIPSITSTSKSSGPVGTIVELRGENLNGFDGATYLYFVKVENGESGSVSVNSYLPTGSTTLRFTLPEKMCTKNMGESGLPCPSYMLVTAGTYRIYAMPWSERSNEVTFTVTAPVTSTLPSITNVSGPTCLQVGELGTWQMEINYPAVTMDKLSFFVVWGDEKTPPAQPSYVGPNIPSGAVNAAKFSHVYRATGTYRPTFTVIDQSNQSVQTSGSVHVEYTAPPSITVISPNGGEAWEKKTVNVIKWSSEQFSSNKAIAILLTPYPVTGVQYIIASDVSNTGSYAWHTGVVGLIGLVPDGTYTIEVMGADDGGSGIKSGSDSSDAFFTITTPLSLKDFQFVGANADLQEPHFQFEMTGAVKGSRYRIESSADLRQWHTFGTALEAPSENNRVGGLAPKSSLQFFRAVKE